MTDKKTKVSYHKKPSHLTSAKWQQELRRQFVQEGKQSFTIQKTEGNHPVFADYTVKNLANKNSNKVALRSQVPGPNFCTCLDFKTNLLGTCKHIEAVLYRISKDKKLAPLLKKEYRPEYSSLHLAYGPKREVRLRIGTRHAAKYQKLAERYFNKQGCLTPDAFNRIEEFLKRARQISSDFRCYPDALDFIITTRENQARQKTVRQKIARRKNFFDTLLTASLYPFQKQGILFAASAGRCLIADDMGLGKTIQAIGAAELFQREWNASRVLIICPTSLKYQWKSEIERFTGREALALEGNAARRQQRYDNKNAYTITSYNVVASDLASINQADFDLVILDEAQRIKNWQTKTARAVKKVTSPYAVVLTGTPIENKLEELYSIIQFIDPFKLGPLYRFLETHQIRDASGKVVGYRRLNHIQKLLSDIVIRRTKQEVMKQLPGRTDKNLFVPLTPQQAEIHQNYAEAVSRLVNKWKRIGWLDEKDRQRLLISLNCMRMVADSTYILDQETRHDTKIEELMNILDTLLGTKAEKVVIFSQWERMTRLVESELANRHIGFAHLHGGVPSRHRKGLLEEFHGNPACRVFLSTDAGGVGLNLQCASTVVNLDIPWNPAVLEQRIARIHRHGQKQRVNVINFISQDSIEQRMLDVLKFKSSLFAGVLENGADEIFMGENRFKRFMGQVEQIAPARPAEPFSAEIQPQLFNTQTPPSDLLSTAADLFGNLAAVLADKKKTKKIADSLIEKDRQSGKSYLKIPLENEQVLTDALKAFNNLLSKFQ